MIEITVVFFILHIIVFFSLIHFYERCMQGVSVEQLLFIQQSKKYSTYMVCFKCFAPHIAKESCINHAILNFVFVPFHPTVSAPALEDFFSAQLCHVSPCWWIAVIPSPESLHPEICLHCSKASLAWCSRSLKTLYRVLTCTQTLFHKFFILLQWSIHQRLCLSSGSDGTVWIALLIDLSELWLVGNSLNSWKAKLFHRRSWRCWRVFKKKKETTSRLNLKSSMQKFAKFWSSSILYLFSYYFVKINIST